MLARVTKRSKKQYERRRHTKTKSTHYEQINIHSNGNSQTKPKATAQQIYIFMPAASHNIAFVRQHLQPSRICKLGRHTTQIRVYCTRTAHLGPACGGGGHTDGRIQTDIVGAILNVGQQPAPCNTKTKTIATTCRLQCFIIGGLTPPPPPAAAPAAGTSSPIIFLRRRVRECQGNVKVCSTALTAT